MEETARLRGEVALFDALVGSMYGVTAHEMATIFATAKAGEAASLLSNL